MSEMDSKVGNISSAVQQKAYELAKDTIIIALEDLGKDMQNSEKYLEMVDKYVAMLRDVLQDGNLRFYKQD